MLRAKMTVKESTSVSIRGGLREMDGAARGRGLLNGGISSTADALLLHAHTAHCCEHLVRRRGLPDMGPLPADTVVVGAGIRRHTGLLGRKVLKAIPAAPHTS